MKRNVVLAGLVWPLVVSACGGSQRGTSSNENAPDVRDQGSAEDATATSAVVEPPPPEGCMSPEHRRLGVVDRLQTKEGKVQFCVGPSDPDAVPEEGQSLRTTLCWHYSPTLQVYQPLQRDDSGNWYRARRALSDPGRQCAQCSHCPTGREGPCAELALGRGYRPSNTETPEGPLQAAVSDNGSYVLVAKDQPAGCTSEDSGCKTTLELWDRSGRRPRKVKSLAVHDESYGDFIPNFAFVGNTILTYQCAMGPSCNARLISHETGRVLLEVPVEPYAGARYRVSPTEWLFVSGRGEKLAWITPATGTVEALLNLPEMAPEPGISTRRLNENEVVLAYGPGQEGTEPSAHPGDLVVVQLAERTHSPVSHPPFCSREMH